MKILEIKTSGWIESTYLLTEKEAMKLLKKLKRMQNNSDKQKLSIQITEKFNLGLQPVK